MNEIKAHSVTSHHIVPGSITRDHLAADLKGGDNFRPLGPLTNEQVAAISVATLTHGTITAVEHKGLPVPGYAPTRSAEQVKLVSEIKHMEERMLRLIDALGMVEGIDPQWLALGRTHVEMGASFMARSVFKPGRCALPEDAADEA